MRRDTTIEEVVEWRNAKLSGGYASMTRGIGWAGRSDGMDEYVEGPIGWRTICFTT